MLKLKERDSFFAKSKWFKPNDRNKEKPKTKNIIFILHYPPPVHGAAVVGEYIRESRLINKTFNTKYINLGTSIRVDEIGNRSFVKIIRYFRILWKTIKYSYIYKPDLVYFTPTSSGFGFYKDALVVFLAKVFNKKMVLHFHNKGVKTRQDRWLDNYLYRRVFNNSAVILLSEHLYYDIAKYVERENVYFCANGIPKMLTINEKNINLNGAIQILFLSNLIESKGVFVLLEACAILSSKGLPFHCTLIGGRGDISPIHLQNKINELGLSKNVTYAGKRYGSEKEYAFTAADIFVHPTLNDCFPLVLLEAMQNSLPIITTDEGGIPDIVLDKETGYLVPKANSQALAEKIEILINNAELRLQMGDAAKKRFDKLFTLEVFESRFCSKLKKLS